MSVIVRSQAAIRQIVDTNPFKNIKITPETRLYVSFLAVPAVSKLEIPYLSSEADFQIIKANSTEAYTVLRLKLGFGTTEGMGILEKEFGRHITTRNWNTVCKLLS